jgi:hypothetical protein
MTEKKLYDAEKIFPMFLAVTHLEKWRTPKWQAFLSSISLIHL